MLFTTEYGSWPGKRSYGRAYLGETIRIRSGLGSSSTQGCDFVVSFWRGSEGRRITEAGVSGWCKGISAVR